MGVYDKDIAKFLANEQCFACGALAVAHCDRCLNPACRAHLVPLADGGQNCAECVAIVTRVALVLEPYILPDGNLDPDRREQLKERIVAMMNGDEGPEMQRLIAQMAAGPAVADMFHKARGTHMLKLLGEETGDK